jgi:hypothetical protein
VVSMYIIFYARKEPFTIQEWKIEQSPLWFLDFS